jgi:hypothetical protein
MIINKSIDFKNIYLLKPINISKNTIYINFKIKTDMGKEPVLIQTPKLFIPFGINKYKFSTNLETSLLIQEPAKQFKDFYISIKKLDKIIEKMKIKNKIIMGKQFISCIKPAVDIFPERILLNINNESSIFDLNKNQINIDQITKKIYGKFIIHLSHIWINESSYGYNLEVIQGMIDPKVIIKEFAFIDDEEPIDKYEKYRKMLSVGVPKEAVKKKIELDGLDPKCIENKSNIVTLAPPPPPPIPNLNHNIGFSKNLLSDLAKNIKLKKVQVKHVEKKKEEDARVPSLDQISSALANLKKINT